MDDQGYGCLYSLFVLVLVIVITLLIAGIVTGQSTITLPDQVDIFPL